MVQLETEAWDLPMASMVGRPNHLPAKPDECANRLVMAPHGEDRIDVSAWRGQGP